MCVNATYVPYRAKQENVHDVLDPLNQRHVPGTYVSVDSGLDSIQTCSVNNHKCNSPFCRGHTRHSSVPISPCICHRISAIHSLLYGPSKCAKDHEDNLGRALTHLF